MTNKETAARLRAIADVADNAAEELGIFTYERISTYRKEDLLDAMRKVGGKWKKEECGEDLHLVHESGLIVSVPRDKVCRKIVRYDCEPLFSLNDHAEIDAALLPEDEKAAAVE